MSKVDISKYFVVGPENTNGRPVSRMIQAVVDAGFTCIQIRSKEADARTLIDLCRQAADIIAKSGRKITLVVDDRLDVVLAARKAGIKVDGIHVGQTDIPVEVCREYLGEDAVIGLSARTHELFDYIKTADVSQIDYFGAGPLHPSITKPNCGQDIDGKVLIRSLADIKKLAELSPIPVVVGGGVALEDIQGLAETGVGGFFIVSAVAGSENPEKAAIDLANAWDKYSK